MAGTVEGCDLTCNVCSGDDTSGTLSGDDAIYLSNLNVEWRQACDKAHTCA